MSMRPASRSGHLGGKLAAAVLGVFLGFLCLEIGLRVAAGSIALLEEVRAAAWTDGRPTYRILCLGESLTAPTVPFDYSWPRQLEGLLNQDRAPFRIEVINKGRRGTTSSDIARDLPGYLEAYRPQMVVTMMGGNDRQWYGVFQDVPGLRGAVRRLKTYRVLEWLYFEGVVRRPAAPVRASLPQPPAIAIGACRALGVDVKTSEAWPACEEAVAREFSREPRDWRIAVALGWFRLDAGRLAQAESVARRAFRLWPDRAASFELFSETLLREGKFDALRALAEKAALRGELAPEAYAVLSDDSMRRGRGAEAERYCRKVLALRPTAEAYADLADVMRGEGRSSEAESLYRKAIELGSRSDIVRMKLAALYLRQGRRREATLLYGGDSVDGMKSESVTGANYRKVLDLVKATGAVLVGVQYPLEDVGALESLLGGGPGVIFVSNKENFEAAVASGRYEDFFKDRSRGAYGHCTRRGYRLIAESVAAAVAPIARDRFR